jgi:hypothetical protein
MLRSKRATPRTLDPLAALFRQLVQASDPLIAQWARRLERGEFASSAEQPASERKEASR